MPRPLVYCFDFDETITVERTGKRHGSYVPVEEITDDQVRANLKNEGPLREFIKNKKADEHFVIVTNNGRVDLIERYLSVLLGSDWNAYISFIAAGSLDDMRAHLEDELGADQLARVEGFDELSGKNAHILYALHKICALNEDGSLNYANQEIVLVDDDARNCNAAREGGGYQAVVVDNAGGYLDSLTHLAQSSPIAAATPATLSVASAAALSPGPRLFLTDPVEVRPIEVMINDELVSPVARPANAGAGAVPAAESLAVPALSWGTRLAKTGLGLFATLGGSVAPSAGECFAPTRLTLKPGGED